MLKSWKPNAVHVLLLSLLVAYLYNPTQSESSITHQLRSSETEAFAGNILLLTAHPDDECMFFAPTILALAALRQSSPSSTLTSRSALYSLCLSVGNADGLGEIRKYELESSLDVLGVDEGKRRIVDHPDLQDNFTTRWDVNVIANIVKPYVLENQINTILTFDRQGISGHPNHNSLPDGVKQLMSSQKEMRLFTLITIPLPAKYAGILAPSLAKFDLYGSNLFHHLEAQLTRLLNVLGVSISPKSRNFAPPEPMPVFVSGFREYWVALQAMRAHSSQLVWFRWLYVIFSRYMWVNEWNEIKVE
ncbi:putative deacetylase LmbE-like domain-containing protein [Mycena sp. CBHHK59/15]|nr:putative deacetylase LmbE-like domain-containing protein [Mycena sp. CBHHK59/15]